MTINLTPISQHGKNRVRQNGVPNNLVVLDRQEGGRIKVEWPNGYTRWVHIEEDPHFAVSSRDS
jgi:hypothetical protein